MNFRFSAKTIYVIIIIKVVFLVYHQKRGFTAFLLAVRSNYKEIIKVLEVHEEKENES